MLVQYDGVKSKNGFTGSPISKLQWDLRGRMEMKRNVFSPLRSYWRSCTLTAADAW